LAQPQLLSCSTEQTLLARVSQLGSPSWLGSPS
jgi:hypothetical protein